MQTTPTCRLYQLALEAGMHEDEIKQDVTLMMAGVAEIDLQLSFIENPMAQINPIVSCMYRVPSSNVKNKVAFYEISVDRVIK